MICKYSGNCKRCGIRIEVGEQISWSRKHRGVIYHITCPDGSKPAMVDVDAGDTRDDDSHDYSKDTETKEYQNSLHSDVFNGHDRGTSVTTKTNGNSSLAAMLATAIQEYLPGTPIDDAAVREIFKQETSSLSSDLISLIAEETAKIQRPAITVEIKNETTGETRDLGVQHARFPLLLKVLTVSNQNVWLAGPSGSGKTQAAQNAADALGLKFYFCGAQSNEYGLLGFTDANGRTVRTLFREAYEHGGVFLFDEIDASANSAVLALNAALANGHCAFPDAVVSRHPDCRIIAAANTWGLGGTNDYVGRVKLDAAFLKRFRFMLWDYDEQLETAISGNPAWAKRVQSVRAKVRSRAIKVIISPRETVEGAKLLASGISQADVEELTIRAGLDATQWESIQ